MVVPPADELDKALELGYRKDASKNVVLITDKAFDTDYGNYSHSIAGLSRKFVEDNISFSLLLMVPVDPIIYYDDSKYEVSYDYDPPETYRKIIQETDGVFGYMSEGIDKILLRLANKIGKQTNSGDWVILDDYSTVKLSNKLSEIDHNDTDRDGLTDAQELGESVEESMDEYINLLLEKHSVPKELYTGKRSITIWKYNSNPTELDTDFDGLPDGNIPYSELLENDK